MDVPYTYGPLTTAHHIRILTLAPSKDQGAALECSIDQLHIDDPVKEYEAISYTWGDQGRTEQLKCDGAIIKITPNLASAFSCLRYQTRPRRLWADAVCINQEDLTEKGQQIPIMGRIFQEATQVRVWLGDGAEGESKALADLASMNQMAGPTRLSLQHPLVSEHQDPETYAVLVEIGRCAKKVLRLPWFGRRWIVQELVLNGNVVFHCGRSQISWQGLHVAFLALPTGVWDDELDTPLRRKLGQLRDLWRAWCYANDSRIEIGIYSLLHSFHDLQCQEPKDKLYAIAGLADDVELKQQPSSSPAGVPSIAPDYKVSEEKVYQDLAFKLINHGKVFDTLAHAGASRIMGPERSLPSWVPDVRQPGPWPLTVKKARADFELVEVCEPQDGILILKVEVYGWEFGTTELGRRLAMLSARALPPRMHPDFSVFEWRPLRVDKVYKKPNDCVAQDGLKLKRDIMEWLSRLRDDRLPDSSLVGNLYVMCDILWCLIRSQLLTEGGYESFDRLPSFEDWRKQYRNEEIDQRWLGYLSKALSTRTIFIGQRLGDEVMGYPIHFWGFGPCDLEFDDVMFFPSKPPKCATVLFLRPEGTEYRVLGGGLAWIWSGRAPFNDSQFRRHEVEVRLV